MPENITLENTSRLEEYLREYNLNPTERSPECESELILLLNLSSPQLRFERLLTVTNSIGSTAVHKAAWRGHGCLLRSMLIGFTSEEVSQILKVKNIYGYTAIHYASIENQPLALFEMFNIFKKLDATDMLYPILKQSVDGLTAMHFAANHDDPETIAHLLEFIDSDERFLLLKKPNKSGQTPLHIAADLGNCQPARVMLDFLQPGEEVQLMDVRDNHSDTAFDIAENHRDMREVLEEYRFVAGDRQNINTDRTRSMYIRSKALMI